MVLTRTRQWNTRSGSTAETIRPEGSPVTELSVVSSSFSSPSSLFSHGTSVPSLSLRPQNFTNNFQTAKEALSAATAQAAERAAYSVRDLAQKSFRVSMDIRLKAPLIIVPQSSTSHNALVMDLGLITVENSFCLLPINGCPLPAVIDSMDVQLTQLKLSR